MANKHVTDVLTPQALSVLEEALATCVVVAQKGRNDTMAVGLELDDLLTTQRLLCSLARDAADAAVVLASCHDIRMRAAQIEALKEKAKL